MFLGLCTKAQDSSIIEIPFYAAKQVQLDLLAKDSVEEMYEYVVGELATTEAKLRVKDTLVSMYSRGILDLTTQLNNEKAMKISYKGIAEDCKKDYDKLGTKFSLYKKRTTFGGAVLGGIALGLAAIILIKL